MYLSSRMKLTCVFSLGLVIALALFGFTRGFTYAASRYLSPTLTCGSWTIVTSPNVSGTNNSLRAIAPISANNIWAVGETYAPYGNPPQNSLIEHWNGSQWSIVKSPNMGTLYSLSGIARVPATGQAWAVGSYTGNGFVNTLIEHWNGKLWSVVKSPNVVGENNVLSAIVATSANDAWAAGQSSSTTTQSSQSLIEHWNGKQWSIILDPNIVGTELTNITALSSKNIWAFGQYIDPTTNLRSILVEHWNGVSWSWSTFGASSSPNGLYFNGFTAISASNIWAVGYNYSVAGDSDQAVIYHWNGISWSQAYSPSTNTTDSGLSGISALATNNIWAVGSTYVNSTIGDQPLIEHWDGYSWSIIASQSPAFSAYLAVASVSNTVWAVGTMNPSNMNNNTQTLIEHYC